MKTPPTSTTITLAARDLRPILAGLGKALPRRPTLPVLECIRIATDGNGTAGLSATDLDCWATVRLSKAATGAPTKFLVPAGALREAARNCKPGDSVSLSPVKGDSVEITASGIGRSVEAPPASEHPTPPSFSGTAHILPEEAKRAIVEGLQCASTDQNRHVLNGVHLDTTGKGHHIVGTDGRHLYSANSFALPLAEPAILASSKLLGWKPVADAPKWTLRLSRDKSGGGSYEITAGAWRIVGRLVSGNYPAWRQVVPARSDLKSCVRYAPDQLAALSATVAKLPVDTIYSSRPVVVRSDGRSAELLWRESPKSRYRAIPLPDARVEGKPFAISLDCTLLAKAFAFGLGEMQVADEKSPARFGDGNGRRLIVMPLRNTGDLPPSPVQPSKPSPQSRSRNSPPTPQRKPNPAPQEEPKPKPTMANNKPPTRQLQPPAPSGEQPLDGALHDLTKVRDTLREAAAGLQSAAARIKEAKQQQRASEKEVRSVRSTLESLRKVRL